MSNISARLRRGSAVLAVAALVASPAAAIASAHPAPDKAKAHHTKKHHKKHKRPGGGVGSCRVVRLPAGSHVSPDTGCNL